jgi:hypothetical protein
VLPPPPPYSFPVLHVIEWYVEADVQRHLPRITRNNQSKMVSCSSYIRIKTLSIRIEWARYTGTKDCLLVRGFYITYINTRQFATMVTWNCVEFRAFTPFVIIHTEGTADGCKCLEELYLQIRRTPHHFLMTWRHIIKSLLQQRQRNACCFLHLNCSSVTVIATQT